MTIQELTDATSPISAMMRFIDDHFSNQRDVYFQIVSMAGSRDQAYAVMRKPMDARKIAAEIFEDPFGARADLAGRALLLRAAIDFHLWSMTDPEEVDFRDRMALRAAASGLDVDDRADRARLVESRKAARAWEAVRRKEASNTAIKHYEPIVDTRSTLKAPRG